MMNDRELLEAAAKAAGIEIDKSEFNGGGAGNTGFDLMDNAVLDWHNGVTWNPLTDDGDAFRLAVKLHIDIAQFPGGVRADAVKTNDYYVPHDADPCAATRRAIVLCAAALAPTP